jgi:hypothetical protein
MRIHGGSLASNRYAPYPIPAAVGAVGGVGAAVGGVGAAAAATPPPVPANISQGYSLTDVDMSCILCMYKYLACVCDNKCFANKLTSFGCFYADFYGELQCTNIFLTTAFLTNAITIDLIIQ